MNKEVGHTSMLMLTRLNEKHRCLEYPMPSKVTGQELTSLVAVILIGAFRRYSKLRMKINRCISTKQPAGIKLHFWLFGAVSCFIYHGHTYYYRHRRVKYTPEMDYMHHNYPMNTFAGTKVRL